MWICGVTVAYNVVLNTLKPSGCFIYSPDLALKILYFLLSEGCGLQNKEPSFPYTDLFFNTDGVFAVRYELILATCLNSHHSRNAPYSSSP